MGIANSGFEHWLYVKKTHPDVIQGKILQLGRQDIYFNYDFFKEKSSQFGVEIHQSTNPPIHQSIMFKILGRDKCALTI